MLLDKILIQLSQVNKSVQCSINSFKGFRNAENITDSDGLYLVSEVIGNIKDTADNLQEYCPIISRS